MGMPMPRKRGSRPSAVAGAAVQNKYMAQANATSVGSQSGSHLLRAGGPTSSSACASSVGWMRLVGLKPFFL